MKQDATGHLSPEELVSSLVIGKDPGGPAGLHLQACPECRLERQRILEDLRALGRKARDCAPEPARKIVLPSREPAWSRLQPFGWALGASFAAAAAAAVILFLAPAHLDTVPGGQGRAVTAVGPMSDAALMADVSRLTENALPDAYAEISPEASTDAFDDDEVLDFVVPISDDDGLT